MSQLEPLELPHNHSGVQQMLQTSHWSKNIKTEPCYRAFQLDGG